MLLAYGILFVLSLVCAENFGNEEAEFAFEDPWRYRLPIQGIAWVDFINELLQDREKVRAGQVHLYVKVFYLNARWLKSVEYDDL